MANLDKREITDQRIMPLLNKIDQICNEYDIPYFFAAGNLGTDKGPGYLSSYRHERTEGKLVFPFIKLIGVAVQNNTIHKLLCNLLKAIEADLTEEIVLAVIRIIEKRVDTEEKRGKRGCDWPIPPKCDNDDG